MEVKKNKSLSGKFWLILLISSIFLVAVIVVGVTLFCKRSGSVKYKNENGGKVYLNYSSDMSGLSIINAVPITNKVGVKNDSQYLDFSVQVDVEEARKVEYELSVQKVEKNSSINDDDIRLYLEKEESGAYVSVFGPNKYKALGEKTSFGTKKGNMVLTTGEKSKSGVDNYRLRMWLSEDSLLESGNYEVKLDIHGVAK